MIAAEGDTLGTILAWCFLAGLVIGVVVLIANKKQGYRLTCPFCGSSMNVGATVCRKCGRSVPRRTP